MNESLYVVAHITTVGPNLVMVTLWDHAHGQRWDTDAAVYVHPHAAEALSLGDVVSVDFTAGLITGLITGLHLDPVEGLRQISGD